MVLTETRIVCDGRKGNACVAADEHGNPAEYVCRNVSLWHLWKLARGAGWRSYPAQSMDLCPKCVEAGKKGK